MPLTSHAVNSGSFIYKFSVETLPEVTDLSIENLRISFGLTDLQVWRDYYIELTREADQESLLELAAVLGDGDVSNHVAVNQPMGQGGMIQIAHRSGVVDNESQSLIEMCALIGLQARAGKVALTYQSSDPRLPEVIRAHRYNQNIEDWHESEPEYSTLMPQGHYEPVQHIDLLRLADDELASVGKAGGRNLSLYQMQKIRDIQRVTGGEQVTDVLLEAMDARWSDHSAHTTWKSLGSLLGRLAAATRDTGNPNIISMFEDNAGVWDFYDGYAIAIKAETHNGPAAVSAYFGQLTKLGGVLRDILGTGLGADPIGCFEYTATGLPGSAAPISGRPSPALIALDTIRAVKEYGNTFGVPMMWSRMAFHPAYRAKPFALGGSIGLTYRSRAQRGSPQRGDMVVLIGGLTGNEGMHGASASSAGATMDEAAVQIGAPLEQVKFRKAIIDLRDADCLRAITDVGGSGLNSAVGEIGESCGVWINTALVPLKTSALPMWRILLSESQERMILAVPPQRLPAARQILERHQVRATVIGRFTGTGRYGVFHSRRLDEAAVASMAAGDLPAVTGDIGFDLPYSLLSYEPPPRKAPPAHGPPLVDARWPELDTSAIAGLLEAVSADPEVASQQYADSQYDSTVQGNTVYGPQFGHRHRVSSSYWAATPVEDLPAAVVFATAFAPQLYAAHPVRALRQMFCGLLARLVLAGAALTDICVCDNFYTPHLADGADGWLVAMVDELAALIRRFGTPVISGKDSSAGSTMTDEGIVHVPPAVFLSGLGKVPHVDRLLGEQWVDPGSMLVSVGPRTPSPAGTAAGRALGLRGNIVDDVDLDGYRVFLDGLAACRSLFRSAAPVGPGGLAARTLLGALAGDIGADLDPGHDAGTLFAEDRCAVLAEIAPADFARIPAALEPRQAGMLSRSAGVRLRRTELLTPLAERQWADSFAAMIG